MTTTDTRENLVRATREAICELGSGGATAREIAGRAGANLASIPYHFGTKDALVAEALVEEARELVGPVLELLASDLPPTERAMTGVQVLNELFEQRRSRVPVYLSAVAAVAHDDQVRAGLEQLWSEVRTELAAEIELLRSSEVIQGWVDADAMAGLILALVNGVMTASVIDPDGPGHADVAAQLLQLLLSAATS